MSGIRYRDRSTPTLPWSVLLVYVFTGPTVPMAVPEKEPTTGTRLMLEVWHPNCWTLEVTDEASAQLLAHTVFNAGSGNVKGHFTVYGESTDELDRLVELTRQSPLTDSVTEMQRRYRYDDIRTTPGNTSRELFVEYDPSDTISDVLVSEGFMQDSPVRVRDGTEYWSVFVETTDRETLRDRLDAVRERKDADVAVTRISSDGFRGEEALDRVDLLSERQREIFALACEHGYYAWPRETTTRELAEEADLSKTTLLEHLRNAEVKLLDPAIDQVTDSL